MVALRPAAAEDCRQVWRWRNDEETRRASLDPAPIPFATHERWFAESLASATRKLYVVVAGGRGAGVVRLDLDARRAAVSIHLAPQRRGQGLGPAALRALADLAFGTLGVSVLIASVKRDNRASLSAFARAGFAVARDGAVVTLERSRAAHPHPGPLPPEGEGVSIPSSPGPARVASIPPLPGGERVRVRGSTGRRRR